MKLLSLIQSALKCSSRTQKSLNSNSSSVALSSTLPGNGPSYPASLLCNNGLAFQETLTTKFNVMHEPTGSKASLIVHNVMLLKWNSALDPWLCLLFTLWSFVEIKSFHIQLKNGKSGSSFLCVKMSFF